MCDRTCKTFLYSASVCVRERERGGLVVLPSSSSNETTAYAFRVALDIIIIIIHFCHSAVTYIHTLHFHAGLKNKRKIEYEKFTKKGLRKSLPNMSRPCARRYLHKGGTASATSYLLCHGCTMLGLYTYQHRNIGKVTKYR